MLANILRTAACPDANTWMLPSQRSLLIVVVYPSRSLLPLPSSVSAPPALAGLETRCGGPRGGGCRRGGSTGLARPWPLRHRPPLPHFFAPSGAAIAGAGASALGCVTLLCSGYFLPGTKGKMEGLITEMNQASCYDMIEQYCEYIVK